jgi:predicted chitinase
LKARFNVDTALRLSGYNGKFKESLKQILKYLASDKRVTDLRIAAYILATSKVESEYSLQRWEADYLCGSYGVPYSDKPCDRALRYYRSTDGKKNYYDLGVDSKGLPYFGRGAIQLTGKANYDTYGGIIGENLTRYADKALVPRNSYDILVEYILKRTKKHIESGDWNRARGSVNGCRSCDLSKVQPAYDKWLQVLSKSVEEQQSQQGSMSPTQKKNVKLIVAFLVLIAVMVGVVVLIYRISEKK